MKCFLQVQLLQVVEDLAGSVLPIQMMAYPGKYAPTPVLTPSPGEWDSYTVETAFVIYENGAYKMWYTGGPNTTQYKIGYATSPDGINWTKHPSNPVLGPGTDAWEAGGVEACYVLPVTGGYKMWYTGYNASVTIPCIGYATSGDGILWQKDTLNNPILEPGNPGEWDDTFIFKPSIIFKDNIYYMWYTGTGGYYSQFRIGLATSPNGNNNWIKYPDNPVLTPSPSGWDRGEVESGNVILVGDTLFMYYDGSPPINFIWQIGLAKSLYSPPLLPGTYTIGTGGNFATIQEAFNKLETDGVAGNVTLELIDELYTAPTDSFGFKLVGPIPGAGENSRVTIKPAENKNVIIEGNGLSVLYFINTSYVTFDGVSITGSTTLTVHAYENNQFAYNLGLFFIDNSDHNTIQNSIFINDDILRRSPALGVSSLSYTTATPDSNLIQSNFIKQAGIGIYVSAYYSTNPATANGNIIRKNIIGSETDTLISWGIQVERNQNAIIEDNVIEGITGY